MKSLKTPVFILFYLCGLGMLAAIGYLYADYTIRAEKQKTEINDKFHTDVTYIDLPPMNLTVAGKDTGDGRIRMNITLEVEKKYAAHVEDYAPRITDRIIDYTRKLDYDDISRPTATSWLRERLLHIANNTSEAAPVMNIVFKEFLVM